MGLLLHQASPYMTLAGLDIRRTRQSPLRPCRSRFRQMRHACRSLDQLRNQGRGELHPRTLCVCAGTSVSVVRNTVVGAENKTKSSSRGLISCELGAVLIAGAAGVACAEAAAGVVSRVVDAGGVAVLVGAFCTAKVMSHDCTQTLQNASGSDGRDHVCVRQCAVRMEGRILVEHGNGTDRCLC